MKSKEQRDRGPEPEPALELGMLNKQGHANFCMRCLSGLPATMAEADSSRVAVGFYCLGTLDILGLLDAKLGAEDREAWKAWIWAQQVRRPWRSWSGRGEGAVDEGRRNGTALDGIEDLEEGHVGGFRPGPFMHVDVGSPPSSKEEVDVLDSDPPHLIMTYTALLALAILRDDFSELDRRGLVNLLRCTQKPDGSFSALPGLGEADMRMVYTAFVICAMLDDWSGVDVPRALGFVKRCVSYEGGFGQAPGNEAQGGPTYCALATLALAPQEYRKEASLSMGEKRRAERWLVSLQHSQGLDLETKLEDEAEEEYEGVGGFGGRTEKDADACYSFWCGAALRILRSGLVDCAGPTTTTGSSAVLKLNGEMKFTSDGNKREGDESEEERDFVSRERHALFLSRCQFRLGGLGKAPGAHPDPYHTYLALAALALYPPYEYPAGSGSGDEDEDEGEKKRRESWKVNRLDALINASEDTARWACKKIKM